MPLDQSTQADNLSGMQISRPRMYDDASLSMIRNLEILPNEPQARDTFLQFEDCFNSCFEESEVSDSRKLRLLKLKLAPKVYSIIKDSPSYSEAWQELKSKYQGVDRPLMDLHAFLQTKQFKNETVTNFGQRVKTAWKNVRLPPNTDLSSVIQVVVLLFGVRDPNVRQKLLENNMLDFEASLRTAITVDVSRSEAGLTDVPKLMVAAAHRNSLEGATECDKSCSGVLFYHIYHIL